MNDVLRQLVEYKYDKGNCSLYITGINTFISRFWSWTSCHKHRFSYIQVKPSQCRMVQHCNSCEGCIIHFEPYEPKALTCYFDKVSQKFDILSTVAGIHAEYNETQLKIKNDKSGTWNISTMYIYLDNTCSSVVYDLHEYFKRLLVEKTNDSHKDVSNYCKS